MKFSISIRREVEKCWRKTMPEILQNEIKNAKSWFFFVDVPLARLGGYKLLVKVTFKEWKKHPRWVDPDRLHKCRVFKGLQLSKQKNRTSQLVTHEGVAPREEHSPNLAQDLDLLSPWPPFSEDSGQSRRTGDEGGGDRLPHQILAQIKAKPSSSMYLMYLMYIWLFTPTRFSDLLSGLWYVF